MNLRSFATAAVAAVAVVMSASSLADTITLSGPSSDIYSGSFSGAATSNVFSLDLGGLPSDGWNDLTSVVTSSSVGSGYNVTNVTFDAIAYNPVINSLGVDYWNIMLTGVSHGLHSITVTGYAVGGSTVGFTGSVGISNAPIPLPAIPEPETYAMMLAGLGFIGFVASRRKRRAA